MKDNRTIIKIIVVIMGIFLAALVMWLVFQLLASKALVPVETVIETVSGTKASFPETIRETETETEPETVPEPEPLHLMFAGDVMLSEHVTSAYQREGDITGVVEQMLLDRMKSADIFMVNEEFPFSEQGKAADKQYTFRSPPSDVHMMKEMGIDIVTLANNHALDFGTAALLDTCSTLEEAGIRYVGAGDSLERAKQLEILETEGKKIGFLGASRVIPTGSWNAGDDTPGMLTTYDPAILLEEIRQSKEQCDYLVVYVHWGIERNETPEGYQRTMGKQYIDAGADLVIGSHPHVLQGIEYYKGKPIVYSLGNFVFGSSIPKTMLLEVVLDDGQAELSLIPGTSSAGYTKAVSDPQKVKEFYQYIERISYGIEIDDSGRIIPPDQESD